MSHMYDEQYYAASRRRSVATPPHPHLHTTVEPAAIVSAGQMSDATNITQPPSYSKKFVVVGDGGCGKTCLLISYSQGYFPEKYVPTVFENYITQTVHRSSGKTVELALWDTGARRIRPFAPVVLPRNRPSWYPEVLHFCPTTPIILVGLKSDLRSKRTCIELLKTQGLTPITPEQGNAVAQRMGATYVECSSKEMRGVDDVFAKAVDMAVSIEEQGWKTQQPGKSSSSAKQPSSSRPGKKIKKRSCKIL
ncbi:hypothetical protein N7470_008603 [Penicillium chermesinum]|nr:hypothetical protein N7470_008603 [Penicillium chermesinum]